MQGHAPAETGALIDHIVRRFHQAHRRQLPELADLARKVETVHFGDPDVPEGLSQYLETMIGTLEVHMKKEELILFPALRAGRSDGVENPIAEMRADHDDHAADIAAIHALTNDLTLPDGACRTWRALHDGLGAFLGDLEAHIRLENEVLFPRFEPSGQKQDAKG